MKHIVDDATRKALVRSGDEACGFFQRSLSERKLQSTRCTSCGKTAWPPRSFCPACHCRGVEWVPLPSTGTLYAFTTQTRAIRFSAPDVIGVVELTGVARILTKIDAPLDSLRIGMDVELSFLDVADGLTVHQFRPLASDPS
jgi:uncharacterized OB-fold protein